MIRIHVVRDQKNLRQIVFKGHADYAECGMDIVCAAVSATFLCTINGIFSLDEDVIFVQECDGSQIIDVLRDDECCQKLLSNMLKCLKSLEEQYPNNIQIR